MVLSGVCVINSAKQQNRIGPTLDAVYFSGRKNVAVDCHFLGYQCVRQKYRPEAFVAFFNIGYGNFVSRWRSRTECHPHTDGRAPPTVSDTCLNVELPVWQKWRD